MLPPNVEFGIVVYNAQNRKCVHPETFIKGINMIYIIDVEASIVTCRLDDHIWNYEKGNVSFRVK